jgi:hypothetical protein
MRALAEITGHEGLAYLDPMATREKDAIAVLEQAATFYQHQLDQYPEALGYLFFSASFSRCIRASTSSTSTAGASALPSPIVSCPQPWQ